MSAAALASCSTVSLASPVLLPHSDDHEGQEHGVDHAQSSVDEACHVVVRPARVGRHEALHQLQPGEREEADPSDHQDAID
jgi:hypothetical protein